MRIKCFMIIPVNAFHNDPRWCKADDPTAIYESIGKTPDGAMYRATWLEELPLSPAHPGWPQPTDGKVYGVKTPGGCWIIDSMCSNCGRKTEVHHCWCRHGEPPNLTVDKNGDTCNAGAGSIQCGNYHGFLRNGHLEDA